MFLSLVQWIGILFLVKILYVFLATVLPSVISKSLATVIIVDLRKKYGPWAVLTGATGGIGKAYAVELAKRKMNLVLISRSVQRLNDTAEYIRNLYSVEVKVIQADFGEGEKIYEGIENELKDLDIGILVNNVGVVSSEPVFRAFDTTPATKLWQEVVINAGATAMMTRMVVPGMRLKRRGIIVNLGSMSSQKPHPYLSNYAATKAYVHLLSTSLHAELQEYNIQVQHLYPGLIETSMTKDNHITAAFVPKRYQHILYPNASLYASWAICTLGLFRETTGYWVFDLMNLVEKMETNDFFATTLIQLLKQTKGKQLQ